MRYVSRQTVLRGMRFHFTEWGDPARRRCSCCTAATSRRTRGTSSACTCRTATTCTRSTSAGHGDTEWSRELDYSMEAMAADALAFIADQQLGGPIIFGHSMGGRVTMQAALPDPKVARALVLVDVGPELSAKGTKVIGEFITHNVEFDDLDVFLENVARYDPFRSREHIARTVKYNLLVARRRQVRQQGRPSPAARRRCATITLEQRRGHPVPGARRARRRVRRARCPTPPSASSRALPTAGSSPCPHVGHNVHGGNTPGFLDAIGPFLASLD